MTEAHGRMAHGHQALSHHLKLLFRLLFSAWLKAELVSVYRWVVVDPASELTEAQLYSFWDFLPVSLLPLLALWPPTACGWCFPLLSDLLIDVPHLLH